jgi:MFS family permease
MVVPISVYSELWGVTFIFDKYSFNKFYSFLVVSLTFVGIGFGGPFVGFLYIKFFKSRFYILLFGSLGSFLCLFLIFNFYFNNIFCLSLVHFLFGFFSSFMLLCFNINLELSEEKFKASIIGFTNSVIVFISIFFQSLIGFLFNFFLNNGNHFYQISFLPVLLCPLVSFFLVFYIIKNS